MKKSLMLWIIAFLVTAASAVYQRFTGPTYPLHGTVLLDGKEISYRLERSHGGPDNHTVRVLTEDKAISGVLEWKRYKTLDEWQQVPMLYADGELTAELPHQPPAGKLAYRVILRSSGSELTLPPAGQTVLRFKGDVPAAVLIIHIIAMFGAMLLSTRAGLEFFSAEPRLRAFTYWTIAFLFVGGFILGPIVQWYAFGALWTGWPVGSDLTDNKTALAILAWLIVAFVLRKAKNPKRWALAAAAITFLVYLIPHSVLGSELDYTKQEQRTVSTANP
jgi:hypothetical protein